MIYKLIVDYGKPYEEIIKNKKELFRILNNLKAIKDNYAYMDIQIFNNKDVDITDKIFKEFEVLK